MARRSTTKKEHYVDNKLFLQAMTEYKEKCDKAKARNRKNPPVTNYIGECFLKIANHLSYRPNFINYTYRDEMICDAIENCIQYIGNFNTEKSNNAFAYVTQICYYAFLRRIQKEKKQVFIKQKSIEESNITMDAYTTIDGEHDPNLTNTNVEWMQEHMNRVEYEPRKSKRAKKVKENTNLEKFTE